MFYNNYIFYVWFFLTPLVLFIMELKTQFNLADDDLSYLQLDGETRQIEPLKRDDVKESLVENKILVGNPPGSYTELSQPVDVGMVIPSVTKQLDSISNDELEEFVPLMNRVQTAVIVVHMAKYKAASSNEPFISTAHQRHVRQGLVKLMLAKRSILNDPKIIKNSFTWSGVHQYKSDKLTTFQRIFKNLRKQPTNEELQRMMEAHPYFVKKMREQGELKDADYEKYNIPGTNKDNYCVSHRRSVLMNHEAVLKREMAIQDAKLAAETIKADKKRKKSDNLATNTKSNKKTKTNQTVANVVPTSSSSSSTSYFNSVTNTK